MVTMNDFLMLLILAALLLIGCGSSDDPYPELRNSLTFYASFDGSHEADVAAGDPGFYMAPSWSQRMEYELFTEAGEEFFRIHEGEGKYGDALWIDSRYEPVFFYKGEDNMPYETRHWSGTVSFWLRLDPAEDLHPGYSDPIQITASAWNDGALFVDFTDEEPRIFRFAIFADREVWDPDEREWDEVPVDERPMVDINDPPFSRNDWTHVAFAFSNFNTGDNDGTVYVYLNGEKAGELTGREQTLTWNPSEVFIWPGYNYRGYFDELSIFDRSLSGDEIRQIYNLENGIRQIVMNRD
jgi:hypothetical protein